MRAWIMPTVAVCIAAVAGAVTAADSVVAMAAMKRQEMTQSYPVPGALQPLEKVMLHAKVTGYLAELKVDVGDVVKRGDVLAVLNIPEMEPQLKLAQANIAVANAELQRSKSQAQLKKLTYDRWRELRKTEAGAVAQQDVDVAEADYAAAQSDVGVSEAKLQVAEADLARLQKLNDYATIHAPFDGTVTRRMMDAGALVVAGGSNSQPIIELMRTDKLELAFEVPERLTWFVKKGSPIEFTLEAVPFKSYKAQVTRLSGSVHRETRGMEAEVEIDNADGQLGPGMFASVRLPFAKMANVAAVPVAAVRSANGQPVIFVVEGGLARQLRVVVLANDGKEAVIGGELGNHTQVVVKGAENLVDGQRVADQGVGVDGRSS